MANLTFDPLPVASNPTTGYYALGVSGQNIYKIQWDLISSGLAPSGTGSNGLCGQYAFDTGFFYVCTSSNSWRRATLNTW